MLYCNNANQYIQKYKEQNKHKFHNKFNNNKISRIKIKEIQFTI
jgi:hypothetical protein